MEELAAERSAHATLKIEIEVEREAHLSAGELLAQGEEEGVEFEWKRPL